MWYVNAHFSPEGKVAWQTIDDAAVDQEDCVKLSFHLSAVKALPKREAIKRVIGLLSKANLPWLIPSPDRWKISLNGLREIATELEGIEWLRGDVMAVAPR